MAKDYNADSIKVLKGLEPVRARPGMYTRTDSPLHVIQEVIDNSADEALAGHATQIDVRLCVDGSVRVSDDGRGIPVDLHPQEKEPTVVVVLTRLHAGGKFDKTSGEGAYAFSGGLHGVGVSVTNALATRLSRDGETRRPDQRSRVCGWRQGQQEARCHRQVRQERDGHHDSCLARSGLLRLAQNPRA